MTREHGYARETTGALEWMTDAACTEIGAELFFAEDGVSNYTQEAKQTCKSCDVRTECLDYAMRREAADERTTYRYGIWGGLTPNQRHILSGRRKAS